MICISSSGYSVLISVEPLGIGSLEVDLTTSMSLCVKRLQG